MNRFMKRRVKSLLKTLVHDGLFILLAFVALWGAWKMVVFIFHLVIGFFLTTLATGAIVVLSALALYMLVQWILPEPKNNVTGINDKKRKAA